MRRRKEDCLFQFNANTKLCDLFSKILLITSLLSPIQNTFCQVNPFPRLPFNPYSNPFGPLTQPPFRGSISGPPRLPHQSWPQLNQVPPPPFFERFPVNSGIQTRLAIPQHFPYPIPPGFVPSNSIQESAPISRRYTGLTPPVLPVRVDGSLGSLVHPSKDVTGIWHKLGLSGRGGAGTTFIPGSSTSSLIQENQVQRILTTTSLTGGSLFNPFLVPQRPEEGGGRSPFPPPPPFPDFQNRHQVSSSLDPIINNRLGLGHIPMIDHQEGVQRNALDSKSRLQMIQNQVFGLQVDPFNSIRYGAPLPPHLAEHVALQMSIADDDDDDDDDDDEDEKKDRFLEAAEEVISSMKQTGQIPPSPSSDPSPALVKEKEQVQMKPLSDPSHKLSDHLIESNETAETSDPSHTFEDHIADEIVAKANDPNLRTDTSDLILPEVIVDAIPGRVSWLKPRKKPKRQHIHTSRRKKGNKEMPFSNGWKHTQEEHDEGSEEDKLFHQLEDMWAGDEENGPIL